MSRTLIAFVAAWFLATGGASAQEISKPDTTQPVGASQEQATDQEANEPAIVLNQFDAGSVQEERSYESQSWRQFFNKAKNDPIAWLTAAIVGLTLVQLWIYWGEIGDTRIIERAYLKITPREPGFRLDERNMVKVRLRLLNDGRTPGTIIGGSMNLSVGVLASKPTYVKAAPDPFASAFLTPTGHVFVSYWFHISDTPLPENTWLVGYVDYSDRFGAKHRAGFARKFKPGQTPNNLGFDKALAGWNYDATFPKWWQMWRSQPPS